MEEKSETLALCLFELQNCLLSLHAISEVINNCRIVHTDKWRTWYWNQKYRSFVNPSWEDKYATSRSGMFIYMSALIFNLSFNLIWRIAFFGGGRRIKIIFSFVTKELKISFLSLCILRHETFDIDDLSRMQDDPLCIHCMSWLINEKYIAMWVNFRS